MSERFALLALCSVMAVASAMIVLALDHNGASSMTRTSERPIAIVSPDIAAPISTPSPPQEHRPDFVKLRPSLQWLPLPEDLPPAETSEAENPDSWSADIRPEIPAPAPGPRLAALPSQKLPWQLLTPGAQPPSMTLEDRLIAISPAANKRLAAKFEAANAVWPPAAIGLVAIKDEKILELFARPNGGAWKLIHRYPVLAASGVSGPKLRQGDNQVPEGVYGVSFLNPNSRYHVSLRINYPNAFDLKMAAKDGRKELGGDIMVHGKAVSIGCLAIGDAAAEELFVIASRIGLSNVKLIIAPTDLRRYGLPAVEPGQPTWLPKLYTEVASSMSEFKAPPSTGLLSFFWN